MAQICSFVCNRIYTSWSSPLLNRSQVTNLTDMCISPEDPWVSTLDIFRKLEIFAKSSQLFRTTTNPSAGWWLRFRKRLSLSNTLPSFGSEKYSKKGSESKKGRRKEVLLSVTCSSLLMETMLTQPPTHC